MKRLLVLALLVPASCSVSAYVHGIPDQVCIVVPGLGQDASCGSQQTPEPAEAGVETSD